MTPGKSTRITAAIVAVVFMCSAAAPASAANSVLLSILLPGLGQAEEGHYGRAAAFASAAIVSWTGLFATQVNYSRSVEKYENEKRTYLYYQDMLERGDVVRATDMESTYQAMTDAYNSAEDREPWRNFFVGALIVTYGVNLVDVLLSSPATGETPEAAATSLEVQPDGFRLVRTIRF